MFPFQKKRAASAAAILALAATLGLTAIVDTAQARPIFMKYDGIDGDVTDNKAGDGSKVDNPADMADDGTTTKRADGAVCCVKPRSDKAALAKPSECRAARGRIVAQNKCPQARRLPGSRKYSNIVLKRG